MVFASLKEWPERWSLFPFDSIYKLKFIVCSVAWRCLSRCNYADSCTKLKQQLLAPLFYFEVCRLLAIPCNAHAEELS